MNPQTLPLPVVIGVERLGDAARPIARGKFLYAGGRKLHVRGVTYGTFRPDDQGAEFPCPEAVRRDFGLMARQGVDAVRTYTAPPRWLLDLAREHGLRVLAGLGAERQAGYLCERRGAPRVEEWLLPRVRECAGHPALLAYAIGNEIPAPLVRWLGARTIERHLERLCTHVREADPGALVTYVNYPTTEYLELPFVDFITFNLYLESDDRLDAYLARLQNLAGDRPVVIAELGLDSLRNGEAAQASALERQLRIAFAAGCAGAFVYAWTDEWHRGGEDVTDWEFGLTRRDRSPKPALEAVTRAWRDLPVPTSDHAPRISVVVCSHNGARTLRDCLEGTRALEYPNHEVIVVDDGSTDATAAIAEEYDCRLVRTANHGLSSARNTGIAAAQGDIVAFTDDDARPDPHWLHYLAEAFRDGTAAGVGGPNIVPAGDGWIAQCVAASPGGPAHVLVSDRDAEHIPGCNMAFRKAALQSISGFDPRFWTAGDDVDLCWRLLDRGERLGFHGGAMVWHHRRGSLKAYWRQQVGYGRAEALLERKWPERYNPGGHTTWGGRIYGPGAASAWLPRRSRIYQGPWGSAPFQRMYERRAGFWASVVLTPEWILVVLALAALSALAAAWPRAWIATVPLALAAAAPILQAARSAAQTRFPYAPRTRLERLARRPLVMLLHLVQPAARLAGRLRHGLTPWRSRGASGLAPPWPRTRRIWRERRRSPEDRLGSAMAALREDGAVVRSGQDFDRWDLEVRGGLMASARLRMAVEEHDRGCQLVRLRAWPRVAPGALAATIAIGLLGVAAATDGAGLAAGILGGLCGLALAWAARDAGAAMAAMNRAMSRAEEPS